MIGIDAGNSLDRPPTGVAVYARNLVRELARAHPDERFAWFYRSNRYLRSLGSKPPANVTRRLLEEGALRLSGRGLRLFHGLNQRLPARLSCPQIATYHDLFALTGDYSTREFRARFARLARETAKRADHVIAVSGHTARMVEDLLDYPRSRITVVHHGSEAMAMPGMVRRRAMLASIGVTRPFLLHVGSLQARKNIERIVAAFEPLSDAVDLVLAGAPGYGADRIEERIRSSSKLSRIRVTGHVSDELRASLYGEAEALVFPSLEEGFGLPVVEAFAAGLPVVASNVSAVPEVAGDAALLVNPLDTGQIADAIERVLRSSEVRAELRRRGAARALRFTWERCAAETWRTYQRCGGA